MFIVAIYSDFFYTLIRFSKSDSVEQLISNLSAISAEVRPKT